MDQLSGDSGKKRAPKQPKKPLRPKLLPISKHYWRHRLLAPLALLLFFALVWRSCSTAMAEEKEDFLVARDTTWYPFALQGLEQNMIGFTDDLFRAISKKARMSITLVDVSSKGLLTGLDQLKWDGALSSLEPTPSNKERYIFSEPFYISGKVLIVPLHSSISSWEGIEGRVVAIEKRMSLPAEIANHQAIFTPYSSMNSALDDLVKNNVDAAIMDFAPAYVYLQSLYRDQLKIATTPLMRGGLRLVARRNPDGVRLVQHFNEGFEELRGSGQFQQLLTKWRLLAQ